MQDLNASVYQAEVPESFGRGLADFLSGISIVDSLSSRKLRD
jgi:hypothetical protein